jgi:hypothetical protein
VAHNIVVVSRGGVAAAVGCRCWGDERCVGLKVLLAAEVCFVVVLCCLCMGCLVGDVASDK